MSVLTRKHFAENALIVGAGALMCALLSEIRNQPACRYRVTGIVTPQGRQQASVYDYPVLGTVADLQRLIAQHRPRVIIVSPSEGGVELTDRQLVEARVTQNLRVVHAETVYEQVTGKLPLEAFEPEDIIYSNDFQPRRSALIKSRILSLGMATAGLILLTPLMLLIAFLIRIDSAGPVFFVQDRSGLAGRRFKLFKFRTMHFSDKQESEWEVGNVHRITRVGRWLRKARLDELPQFFNVLRGDMNIVGPRPHPVTNFELFVLAARNTPDSGIPIPFYAMRSSVRPGITGWAQVRYQYANNLQEEMEKLRFDLYYLKHYSLRLDIRILFETVAMVFKRHPRLSDQAGDVSRDAIPLRTNESRANEETSPASGEVERPEVRRSDVA